MKRQTLIGKTEAKILEYLACHPNQLIKPLSQNLRKNIKTINDGVKNLQKKGYLTTIPTKSQKGVEYSGYRLSEKGLAYIVAYGPQKTLFKTVETYEKILPTFRDYKQLINLLSPKITIKLLRMAGKTILQYEESAWLPATPFMVASSGIGNFTEGELNELITIALKIESLESALQKKARDFSRRVLNKGN